MAYFLLECLGPGIPTVTLYKTHNEQPDINLNDSLIIDIPIPKLLVVLQNNTKLSVSILINEKTHLIITINY